MTSHPELLALADWRRRIAELYAEVRRASATSPAAAHATWRAEREALYRGHPASPVPIGKRGGFRAVHWSYADAWRRTARPEPEEALPETGTRPAIAFIPTSTGGPPPLELAGHVTLALPGGSRRLPVLRLLEYAGGIFLPFGDATSGGSTYADLVDCMVALLGPLFYSTQILEAILRQQAPSVGCHLVDGVETR